MLGACYHCLLKVGRVGSLILRVLARATCMQLSRSTSRATWTQAGGPQPAYRHEWVLAGQSKHKILFVVSGLLLFETTHSIRAASPTLQQRSFRAQGR